MKAPLPPDEAQRLMSLRKYEVLDTLPEQSFDDLALLASHICQTPIALVSLVDEKRQWFKSKIGMSATETSRDIAFCAHTILHKDQVFEVRDAQLDPRFADNELVTKNPHVRFYAGAPLVAPDGHALGALCVMDRVPRRLSAEQLNALRAISRHVVAQLELQRQSRELANQNADRQWAQILVQQQFARASANKKEADRLLALAEKSRRAILSVLEDEKLVGQNLRKSEERYRQLLIWLRTPSCWWIWKRTATWMSTRPPTALRLQPTRKFFQMTPEDISAEPEATREHINAGDVFVPLRWHRKKNGERFAVEIKANNIEYKSRPTALVSLRDITERLRAEEALREAGRFNQSTIDALSSHLCVLDETGTILATNMAWEKFAELNPPQPHRAGVGANYLQICDEATGKEAEDAAKFATGVRAVIRGERAEFAMEYPCHSPTEQRWFVGHVTRFPDGGPVRVVVAHENITGQRKLEAQFRQAQKMEAMGQLAGGIAHDFNNILAVIQIQMEMMKAGDNLSVEQVGLADEIGLSVQRASALTRQVLLFSRKQTLQPRDLDLNESINEMTKMLRRILGEDIELSVQIRHAVPLRPRRPRNAGSSSDEPRRQRPRRLARRRKTDHRNFRRGI